VCFGLKGERNLDWEWQVLGAQEVNWEWQVLGAQEVNWEKAEGEASFSS